MASSCSIGGAASHKRAKLSLIVLAFLAEVDESSQDEHRVICVARAASVLIQLSFSLMMRSEWRECSTDRMI